MAITLNAPSQVRPYATFSAFPATGAVKTIYIDEEFNKMYRWTGSAYVELSETDATTWGSITGDITSQNDLQLALDAKFDNPTGNSTQYLDGAGTPVTFPAFASADKMVTVGRNSTGSTLYKGTIVYISGSTGNRPNFVKAQANAEATSAGTFGVIEADIANNADGNCVTIGTIDNLDTRSSAPHPFTSDTLADGDTIYLSPTTAGFITNVKPYAPSHLVYLGKVVRTSPTNGTIVYRVQNGYELDEIHDVSAQTPSDGQVLTFETATQLWKPKTIATGITIGTTAITSGTVGRLLFEGTGNVVQESANITWNNTTNRFQIIGDAVINTLYIGLGGGQGATNTAVGVTALNANTTGVSNTAFGFETLLLNSTGSGNTAFGRKALRATTGSSNLAIGNSAMENNTSGTGNIAFGEGGGNVNTTGSSNIFIGNWSTGVVNNASNRTWIGNTSTTSTYIAGNVLINTTTDAGYKLDVNGTVRVQGPTGYSMVYDSSGVLNSYGTYNALKMYNSATLLCVNLGSEGSNGRLELGQNGSSYIRLNGGSSANDNYIKGATLIGANYSSANSSSVLECRSTTQGFLPPRMTTTQKNAIASPSAGLMVYDTTLNLISVYNGTTWITL